MADAPSGLTRRRFLAGGAAGAAAVWVAPKLGWWGRADALPTNVSGIHSAVGHLGQLPFADDFHQELPGARMRNWSVARPVQLAGMTQFGTPAPANNSFDTTDFLSGHGIVVVMNGLLGASLGPGRMETTQAFAFAPGRYRLAFQVAGCHRAADPWPATMVASVPGCAAATTVSQAAGNGFLSHSLEFRVTETAVSTIVFESRDAPGQAGLVLSQVSLAR